MTILSLNLEIKEFLPSSRKTTLDELLECGAVEIQPRKELR
jgi:hypothetical protein